MRVFFVLSASNSYRLWNNQQIKQQFSEDVSYMAIFNFYEKQFFLNDTNQILQKHFFDQKIQIFVNVMF